MYTCPYCNATNKQVKSGLNPSGSQRYLCRQCDRIYTPQPNPNGYSEKLRQQAIQLRRNGLSYRAIGKHLNVGAQSVVNWVRADENGNEL